MDSRRHYGSHDIPGLTGLRGVAAIWVVFFHLFLGQHVRVIEQGYLGVDIFFILSGFVLSLVYASKLGPNGDNSYTDFLRARIARIYPLHLFTLCVLGIVVLAIPSFSMRYSEPERRFGADAFLASMFLIQNWFYWLPSSWNTPAWSLSAEWLAYLSFPLVLAGTQMWRSRYFPLFLAFLCLFAFYAAMTFKGIVSPNVTGVPGLVRMACEFTCGCLLYRASANGLQRLPIGMDFFAVILLLVSLLFRQTIFLTLPAFAFVVLLAGQNHGWVAQILSTRPLVFLGVISYSIYLVHYPVLQLSNWFLQDSDIAGVQKLFWNAGLLLSILGLSTLTYWGIEVPARTRIRRLRPYAVRPTSIDPAAAADS